LNSIPIRKLYNLRYPLNLVKFQQLSDSREWPEINCRESVNRPSQNAETYHYAFR